MTQKPDQTFQETINRGKALGLAEHIRIELERLFGLIMIMEDAIPSHINTAIGQSMEHMAVVIKEYE